MELKVMEQSQQQESIFFAPCAEDIVAVRVIGRGSHLNSPALQEVADRFFGINPKTRFIIDLSECETMDSTFMGSLAGITLRQRKAQSGLTVIVHTNEHNRRLLDVLGLSRVLDFTDGVGTCDIVKEDQFIEGHAPEMTRLQRTLHMIQAHERLVNIDTNNAVEFRGVIESLKESLDRERTRLE